MRTISQTALAFVLTAASIGSVQANHIQQTDDLSRVPTTESGSSPAFNLEYGLAAVSPRQESVAQRFLAKRQISSAQPINNRSSASAIFN